MITGEEKLFKLITKTENEEEQKEYLKELKDMLEPKIQNKLEAYSLNEILFKNPVEKKDNYRRFKNGCWHFKGRSKEPKRRNGLNKKTSKGKRNIRRNRKRK